MLIRATSIKGKYFPAVLAYSYYNISIRKFTLILCHCGLTMQECFNVVLLCLPNNNLSLTNRFSR